MSTSETVLRGPRLCRLTREEVNVAESLDFARDDKVFGNELELEEENDEFWENGLAVAELLSRAGDVVGDILGTRSRVHHFRRAPGFC